MGKDNLLVTCEVKNKDRELLQKRIGEQVRVTFLQDLSARERAGELAAADILLTFNPLKELTVADLRSMANLRFVQLLSAGADHVPFSAISREVTVAGNIGAYALPMAEHVLGMTLALAKRLFINHSKLKAGEFNRSRPNLLLRGMTCAIVGFGGIGQATARLMQAVGARIQAINTSGRTSQEVDFIGTLSDLETVLRAADVAVLSLPLTKTTQGLIGARELSWMKPQAILINVARGPIIDETALFEHLHSNPEFMAGIDVWWVEPFKEGEFRTSYPFLELPNVLGSPHNSALVPGVMHEALRHAVDNLQRYFAKEPLQGVMNQEDYPDA